MINLKSAFSDYLNTILFIFALTCVNINILPVQQDGKKETWELQHTLTHTNTIGFMRFSPDGTKIITIGSDQKTITIWNIETGHLLHTLKIHTGLMTTLAFSADGTKIATGLRNFTVIIWNIETSHIIHTLKFHDQIMTSNFSPDSTKLATGLRNGTAIIWDIETGHSIHTLENDPNKTNITTNSVQFSSDGTNIIVITSSEECFETCCNDKIGIWDTNTGQPLHILLPRHKHTDAQFSSDGTKIFSVGLDETSNNEITRIWDTNTGNLLHTLKGCPEGKLEDSTKIIPTLDEKNLVRIWDTNTGNLLHTLKHTDPVWSFLLSPDGTKIITSSYDHQTTKIWDTNTGHLINILHENTADMTPFWWIFYTNAIFSPDSTKIITPS